MPGTVDPGIDAAPPLDDGAPPIVDGLPDAPPDAPPDAAIPVTTDHPSAADTFLFSGAAATNYSTQTSALVDGAVDNGAAVVLVRFDLTALPPGTTITAAELHLWTDTDPGLLCTFYQLLEPWDEPTATWSSRSTGVAWTGAGAAPPSRGTVALGALVPSQASTEYTLPLDPTVVTSWLTPATNYGLVITSASTDGTRFSTREHGNVARRPYVRITHVP